MNRSEIDRKYLAQQNTLESETFDILDEGLPNQHRQLKAGKSLDAFNAAHGQLWKDHRAELIAEGLAKPATPQEPKRDLPTEIDELKAEIDKLKVK